MSLTNLAHAHGIARTTLDSAKNIVAKRGRFVDKRGQANKALKGEKSIITDREFAKSIYTPLRFYHDYTMEMWNDDNPETTGEERFEL